MKFSVQKTVDHARLGLIHGLERLPDFRMETPNLFFYTKGGALPYLTPDILSSITKINSALYFPIPSILSFHERMKKFSGSIGDFVGMENQLTYASVVDSGQKRIAGYHTKKHLPVWSKAGKADINAETYMDFMEALKPDIFMAMCDSDTDLNSSQKRVFKSLERSSDFFDNCMDKYEKSEILKNTEIIGSLVGGYNKEAREKCSAVLGKTSVFGVAIEGLHDCSKEVSLIKYKQIKEMIEASLRHIPQAKIRICHGSWNPSTILDLVSSGIDIFDTSYPCLAAEDGGALIFPCDEGIFENTESGSLGINNGKKCDLSRISLVTSVNESEEPECKKVKTGYLKSQFYISLKDKVHVESLEPISKNCSCLTCKSHTKAYIHHLLNVKELLGRTLLIIHNLHQYLQFFENIRMALKTGEFENMKLNWQRIFNNEEM